MTNEEKLKAARQYVDRQLETMKKYGSAPEDVSEHEYRAFVEEVVATVEEKPSRAA